MVTRICKSMACLKVGTYMDWGKSQKKHKLSQRLAHRRRELDPFQTILELVTNQLRIVCSVAPRFVFGRSVAHIVVQLLDILRFWRVYSIVLENSAAENGPNWLICLKEVSKRTKISVTVESGCWTIGPSANYGSRRDVSWYRRL
jgi:hypothetical protein